MLLISFNFSLSQKFSIQMVNNRLPDYQFLKVFRCACYPDLRPYNKHKWSSDPHSVFSLATVSIKKAINGYNHQVMFMLLEMWCLPSSFILIKIVFLIKSQHLVLPTLYAWQMIRDFSNFIQT